MNNLRRAIGIAAGFASVAVVIVTVGSLPWMLGGVVPAARLTLLIERSLHRCSPFRLIC
ncbi:MAG: hypothetical protein R3C49_16540 [Planctomycetaceae bacterium]